MSTITLPNIRVGSDLQVRVRLKDDGVAIDWSTLQNIKACIYSDAQRALAGRCSISIDAEDSTLLVCNYAANKPQYLGTNRIVVSVKYMGETKTYDKPAFTFVRWTADQEGEEITIDDPDVDVEIDVEDISSSILQEAVDAAFSAAGRANEAAAAAEHMVDIHTGPKGDKGDTGDTPDISIGTVTTVEPDEPAAASMSGTPEAPVLNLSIPKGMVGATPNFTVGEVTTGQPGTPVVVTLTGTAEAPVLNITIPQGMQGNSGYQGAAGELQVVNNLTDGGATAALSAEMGKVLDGKVSQLQQKVGDLEEDPNANIYLPLIGQDAVTNKFSLIAGRRYRIWIKDWPANQTSGANKFALRYSTTLSGTYTDQFVIAINAVAPEYHDFVAQTNYYDIWARGNNGEAVKIVIEDITSLQEIRDDLFFLFVGAKNSTQTAVNTLNVHNYDVNTVTSDYIEIKNQPFDLALNGTIASGYHIGMRVLFFDENYNILASRGDYGNYAPPKTFNIANTKYIKISVRYYDASNNLVKISPEDVEAFGINVPSPSKIDISIGALNDKRFYLPALGNLKFSRRNVAGSTLTPPPLTLLQFTDLHGDIFHLSRVSDFAKDYALYIDDVIHLGDAVYNAYGDDFAFWSAPKYSKFLNVIGNHDAASGGTFTSSINTYNTYFAPYIANWGVTQPTDAATNGYCYYYKDYTTQGIRLIVCDSMHWDATQNAWLQSTLSAARTAGLSVIVAQHYPLSTEQCSFIPCGFTSFKTGLGVSTGMPADIIGSVDSFIADGGKFICHINGHTHIDIVAYTRGSTYKQLSITTDTATDRLPQWQDGDRPLCSKSTDAFNIVGFDTVSKTIRIVKVGKNLNQAMQKALAICVAYDETGETPPAIYSEV